MKRYRELDMSEVLRMLADNLNQTFAVKYGNETTYEASISVVSLDHQSGMSYQIKEHGWHRKVYEIIEIPDPLIPLKKLEAIQELLPEHEWIAMDKTAKTYLFTCESPINEKGMWSNGYVNIYIPTLNCYAKDWRESLIHIPTEIERIKKLESEA